MRGLVYRLGIRIKELGERRGNSIIVEWGMALLEWARR